MYVGPLNPKADKSGNEFYLPAINSLDAAGLKHDKAYASAQAAGFSSAVGSLAVIDADKALVKDALSVVDMFIKGTKDPITKQKVSYETMSTAYDVVKTFTIFVVEKSIRIGLNDSAQAFKATTDAALQNIEQNLQKANSLNDWIPKPTH